MDLFDDIFDGQLFQFSPLRFTPSPEPFTPEVPQDPIVGGTENVNEETVGLISNIAIPSTSRHPPNLIPFPETLTPPVQNPPEMEQQQLLCNSHGYLQGNLPNRQADQQILLDQNMLDYFQEPYVSEMQQQQFFCNSHGYLQGNLPNGQLDQQYSFNQNTMSSFQGPNDSTMTGFGQQIQGGISGYAHPTMTQSFELPNQLQEQFGSQNYPSYPTYQHGSAAPHFSMYDQQPPPLVLANREDEPLVPRVVTDSSRTYPLQNQIFVTPPLTQMPSSSTRVYPLQNQISVTPPVTQMPSSSTRNQGNVQELVNQPSPRCTYPTLDSYAHLLPPCTSPLANMPISVLGRRHRSNRSHFDHQESSSSSQRRRYTLPRRNIDSTAANLAEEGLQNTLYDPRYEMLGLKIDPHLRKFSGYHPRRRG